MAVFRVGAFDAEILEKEFAPVFTMEDLVNLGFVQIYLKLMVDGITSQPFSAVTLPPIEKPENSYKEEIIEFSRATYARPRDLIEENIKLWHEPVRIEREVPKEKSRPSAAKEFIEEKAVVNKKEIRIPLERSQNTVSFSSSDVAEDVEHSMELLARQNKFKKAASPSKESKSELRAALSGILEKEKNKEEIKNPALAKDNPPKYKNPPEVPEDVLKKILDVEQ
jgi:hypothetical protein